MIRFVLRFVGLVLLALGFLFLVHDGTKSIADQTVYTAHATGQYPPEPLTALQPGRAAGGAWV
jgi:hypothetical protein